MFDKNLYQKEYRIKNKEKRNANKNKGSGRKKDEMDKNVLKHNQECI